MGLVLAQINDLVLEDAVLLCVRELYGVEGAATHQSADGGLGEKVKVLREDLRRVAIKARWHACSSTPRRQPDARVDGARHLEAVPVADRAA